MRRDEATDRLLDLAARATARGELLDLIDTLYVYGAYTAGDADLDVVEISVEFTLDEQEHLRFAATFLDEQRDRRDDLVKALRGGGAATRALQIGFEDEPDLAARGLAPQLFWQRGDSVETARARLATPAR